MLLEQHLVEYFANLPYLSVIEVIKHLDKFELTKLAIISENWSKTVEFQLKKREKNEMSIQLKTLENSAKLEVCFGHPWKVLSIDFFGDGSDRVVLCDPESIEIHSKDARTRESTILRIIDLLRSTSQFKIEKIELNFDHGYSLKFFGSLDLKLVVFLTLESERARINERELAKILEKIEVRADRTLKMKSIRNFQGGEYLLNKSIVLEDSRWITGKMLVEKFCSHFGHFNQCRFTDNDYNQLLRKVKDDENWADVMEFQSEHKLNIDKVIRGLDAKPWDRAVRSTKKNVPFWKPLRIVDLSDGWDFRTKSNRLITVWLSENRKTLQIHDWEDDKFPLTKLRKVLKSYRKHCIRMLEYQDLSRRRRMGYEADIIETNAEIRLIEEELEN